MITARRLPRAAPARVLALGAWLKNSACLLDGGVAHLSPLHGDLSSPDACEALERSADELLDIAGGRVDAVAHDLHPDFESTRLAQAIAARLGVPAVPVQHHHAHVGVVLAEMGLRTPVIGITLDGVGLGTDGTAWGGELLWVQGAEWQRLGHLTPLLLPGGDVAAREPWRMAAAALHALGRGGEIVPRFGPVVSERLAGGVQQLLQRGLNCPRTTSAGRWFDAIAGLLAFSTRQQAEAEAAIALERAAADWIAAHGEPAVDDHGLDLRPLARHAADAADPGEAAARFHVGLAQGLATAATQAARDEGIFTIVLGGGCFFNRVLADALRRRLHGFAVLAPANPGDGALALGQAWVAAATVATQLTKETPACASHCPRASSR